MSAAQWQRFHMCKGINPVSATLVWGHCPISKSNNNTIYHVLTNSYDSQCRPMSKASGPSAALKNQLTFSDSSSTLSLLMLWALIRTWGSLLPLHPYVWRHYLCSFLLEKTFMVFMPEHLSLNSTIIQCRKSPLGIQLGGEIFCFWPLEHQVLTYVWIFT